MVHEIILVDCPPNQHKALIDAINKRKYAYDGKRSGYNQVHCSEVRLYNFRMKKEVAPFFLRDLGAWNVMDAGKVSHVLNGIDRWQENLMVKKPKHYLVKVVMWCVRKLLGLIKIFPPGIAEGDRSPFVQGWNYCYALGEIKDLDRGYGEEL